MTRLLFGISGILLLLATIGCGNNMHVSGKVRFEDGSPLKTGIVVFSSQKYVAKGPIQPDGSYTIGSLKSNDGLPPGEYKVYIVSAVEPDPNFVPASGVDAAGTRSAINMEFTSSETTPLSCLIEKRTVYDITVRPGSP